MKVEGFWKGDGITGVEIGLSVGLGVPVYLIGGLEI